MQTHSLNAPASRAGAFDHLQRDWLASCERYLPLVPPDSLWRYHRRPAPQDPEQGWKLHVSATVLTAAPMLERVAPWLSAQGVQFKAPVSLRELQRLNSGLHHGYSQIGKCLTVYPRTTAEALALAESLHERTAGLFAPAVPFEQRLRPGSNVFYRYGAFRHFSLTGADGTQTLALRDPQGAWVLDDRSVVMPAWMMNPFPAPASVATAGDSPLKTTYRVCRALTQRGKGGVYLARDLSVAPSRWCVLKEGRRHGEVSWDGRDGAWRVQHEAAVLTRLRAAGVETPRVYATFELQGNFYLVTEWIAGENLQEALNRRQRRLPLARALRYGCEVAEALARMHQAGWVWRDCKPANLMLTATGKLRLLDFEGACAVAQPDALSWSTPAFAPPAGLSAHPAQASVADDLYALGAVLLYLLTGQTPETAAGTPLKRLRQGIPASVRRLVETLLQAPPAQRPPAREIARQLSTFSTAQTSIIAFP